jgi:hypothetical protein
MVKMLLEFGESKCITHSDKPRRFPLSKRLLMQTHDDCEIGRCQLMPESPSMAVSQFIGDFGASTNSSRANGRRKQVDSNVIYCTHLDSLHLSGLRV